MGRYYFDSFDGNNWTKDERGVECASERDALKMAQTELPEIARDEIPDGDKLTMIVRVRDDNGPLLETSLTLQTVRLR